MPVRGHELSSDELAELGPDVTKVIVWDDDPIIYEGSSLVVDDDRFVVGAIGGVVPLSLQETEAA